MGFLADYCGAKQFPGQSAGRQLWDRAFGTAKEDANRSTPKQATHSLADANQRRLLQALRSNAPGGWTDNRLEASNHFVGIAYAAGHRKYEQMSQAEFQVFITDPDHPKGKRPVSRKDTDAYRLVKLLERPNHEDSFGDLLYCWSQQMDLSGMALTWTVESKLPSALEGKGLPMELYPLPTATCVPQAAMNAEFPEGYYRVQALYPYGPFSTASSPYSAAGAALDARWMLRFKFPHPLLRYEGYAPYTALRLQFDEVEAMDRSRWYKMLRSFNPTAVMSFDEMEGMEILPGSEIDRIHAEFENTLQGPENHGKLVVCPPGGRLDEFGSRPIDMEYQAGWEQLVSFLMAGLGITKPAAGMIESSSYATLYATLKQLHLLTLKPMCDRFAAKLTRGLAPYFGDDLVIEIRCPRIDDHDIKQSKVDMLARYGAITYNQLLEECDMPTTDEEWGNERVGKDQPEQQQGAPGQEPPPMGGGEMGVEEVGGLLDEQVMAQGQPTPGKLGQGALGPRMKRFHLNGNGKARLVRK